MRPSGRPEPFETYDYVRGCLAFPKIAIVKMHTLAPTLSKTHRKVDTLFHEYQPLPFNLLGNFMKYQPLSLNLLGNFMKY